MTQSTIRATLIRSGLTREAASREAGLYDPMDDPAESEAPALPYPPPWADHREDAEEDHDLARWGDDGGPAH